MAADFQAVADEATGRVERGEGETKWARLRGKIFLTFSMTIAVPLFCVMLAIYPFVWLLDRHRRRAEHAVNKFWAWSSTAPFNKVTVRPLSHPPFRSPICSKSTNPHIYMYCVLNL